MTPSGEVDAVVIGAGHNGLVAATVLADAGWDVVVLEAGSEPGGAVRSAEVTAPGYVSDLFSAFYPMAAASPVMTALGLGDFGLVWTEAPTVLAHLRPGREAAVLKRDPAITAERLDKDHRGDGEEWLALQRYWDRYGQPGLAALLGPFPPLVSGARLAWRARKELLELARLAVLPVRRLAQERFGGDGPGLLLAGNALHADVSPEAAPSAALGWLLCGLGQTVGFPVPVGGAGQLSAALVRRLAAAGGVVRCRDAVERVEVAAGRIVSVHSQSGTWRARRAVVAACDAELLFTRLLRRTDLPSAYLRGLRRFHRAHSTVKVNWALDARVPWTDHVVVGAGTVHIGDSLDELSQTSVELAQGRLPARPFLLVGQMTTCDTTRSPPDTESLWAYTHIPHHIVGDAGGELAPSNRLRGDDLDQFVARMEARIEAHAPGFRAHVVARHVQGPEDLEAENPSLVGGDISGGTAQLHQQLVFRPTPGLARPETPIRGLFLGSSSAHPGASVHGACGANAARAAIWHDRMDRARQQVRRAVRRAKPAG